MDGKQEKINFPRHTVPTLIRVMPASGDPRIVPVLYKAIKDPSRSFALRRPKPINTYGREKRPKSSCRRPGMTTASSGSWTDSYDVDL